MARFSIFPLMVRVISFVITFGFLNLLYAQYYPDQTDWQRKSPSDVDLNVSKIDEAVQFAMNNEYTGEKDLRLAILKAFSREPYHKLQGPTKERGGPAGLIIKDGYIVAEWGDLERVDMTFSVSKSFLSSVVGVAYDQGLIKNINDKVHTYMSPIFLAEQNYGDNKAHTLGDPMTLALFDTEHNRKISWNNLLRQTSDWEGTLWGKPDWADRPNDDPSSWIDRPRNEPGSVYKYNDTRVNVLALAACNLWNRPIQSVLKEYVMNPIGASNTWRWMGYHNSWIILNGQAVQVPSGGGHWGGGMFINAYDQARFGYLTLHRGKWKDQQILSEEWVSMALTPTTAKPDYGFMNWFLNTDQQRLPDAPESSYFHLGAGVNMVYVDPENNLVVVARWLDGKAMNGLVKRVLNAMK